MFRTGLVFRADALHRLTDADAVALAKAGVGRVFDLRSAVELERDGVGAFVSDRCRYAHVPMVTMSLSPFDPDVDWTKIDLQDRYLEMLEQGAASIRTVLGELAEPGPAAVYHCSGGKDRTGVMSAVLLRLLGTDDEEIVADYATSEGHLRAMLDAYHESLRDRGLDREVMDYLTSSPPERMRRTLARMDERWGSILGYLDAIGVDETTVARLSERLLV